MKCPRCGKQLCSVTTKTRKFFSCLRCNIRIEVEDGKISTIERVKNIYKPQTW